MRSTYRAAAFAVSLALLPALAGAQQLQFVNALSGTTGGLGTVLTVLSLKDDTRNDIATGCVTPAGFGTLATCGFANNTLQEQSQTRLVSELGGNTATLGRDLRIVANFNEPQNAAGQAGTVDALQLQLFNAAGMVVYTGTLGSNGPVSFPTTNPGVGNIGFAFGFTAAGATAFQTALTGLGSLSGARIGLGASLSDVQGGLDSFYLTRLNTPTSTVPEPSTWALFGTGLLTLGGMAVRRRRGTEG